MRLLRLPKLSTVSGISTGSDCLLVFYTLDNLASDVDSCHVPVVFLFLFFCLDSSPPPRPSLSWFPTIVSFMKQKGGYYAVYLEQSSICLEDRSSYPIATNIPVRHSPPPPTISSHWRAHACRSFRCLNRVALEVSRCRWKKAHQNASCVTSEAESEDT